MEILPPSVKSGVGDLSSQDDDGLWRVTCLNTKKSFVIYNDPRHWNGDVRDEFLRNRLGLWDKSYYGYTRKEAADIEKKIREDIEQSFNQEALPKN